MLCELLYFFVTRLCDKVFQKACQEVFCIISQSIYRYVAHCINNKSHELTMFMFYVVCINFALAS